MVSPRILLVQDDPLVAQQLSHALTQLGYTVLQLAPAESEAIRSAIQGGADGAPDLVLMDIHLSAQEDGIQASPEVCRQFDLPVVYLVGEDDLSLLPKAVASQPHAFLFRPVQVQALQATIEVALHRHQFDRQLKERLAAADAQLQQQVIERRQAEQSLQDSKEKREALLRYSSDFCCIVDKQGQFLYHSPAAARILGYTDEEMADMTDLAHLVHPDDLPRTQSSFAELAERPWKTQVIQCRLRSKRDTYLWIEAIATNHLLNPAIRGIVANARDVTARREIEQALQRSEQKFRGLVQQSRDGIAIIDSQGRIIEWNRAMEEIVGLAAHDAMGQPVWKVQFGLRPPGHKTTKGYKQYRAMVTNLLHTGQSPLLEQRLEQELIRPDGTRCFIELFIFPIQTEHGLFLGTIVRDCTARKQMEEDLAHQRDRLEELVRARTDQLERRRAIQEAVLDCIVDGIVACRQDGILAYINRAAREIHGLPAQPIPPDQWAASYNLYYSDGVTPLKVEDNPLYRAWRGEQVEDQEYVIARPDQPPQTMLANGRPVQDSHGNNLGAVISIHNITEQQQTQKALVASIHRWHVTFDAINDPIFLTDLKGAILNCNRAAARFFGRPFDQILGHSYKELRPELSRLVTAASLSGRRKTGRRHTTLSIGKRYFNVTVDPFLDGQGELTGGVYVLADVTEQRRAAEALRRSEEKYRTVAEFTYDWEAWLAPDGHYLYVSPSCERITGYPAQEFLDNPLLLLQLVHPLDRERVAQHLCEALGKEQAPEEMVFRIVTRDGQERWIDHRCQPVYGADGSWLGRRINNSDITARRQAEAEAANVKFLREVDHFRSELLANVSHELRTPLGLIRGFCSSLLMGDIELDRVTQIEFLNGIDEEVDRLQVLVDNLLSLSRQENGNLHLNRRPTDVGQLVRKMVDSFADDIRFQQYGFVYSLPPAPLTATVDAMAVEQVLRNLMDNAIKYSPAGGMITLRGHREGDQVLLAVQDEGIGIPAGDLEKIFVRFYRVDDEHVQQVGGVGLGLAVCRGIVEAHGGRIWAESALGRGSTFFFTLPNQ